MYQLCCLSQLSNLNVFGICYGSILFLNTIFTTLCTYLQVVYSHTGKVGTETISKPGSNQDNGKEDEEEEDFDIDAI